MLSQPHGWTVPAGARLGPQKQVTLLVGPPQLRAAEAECLGSQWVPLILGCCCGSRDDSLCARSALHLRGLSWSDLLTPSSQPPAWGPRGSSCVLRAYIPPTTNLPSNPRYNYYTNERADWRRAWSPISLPSSPFCGRQVTAC